MKMIRVASRKSDLARLQAHTVAEALQAVDPLLKVEFQFRESLGDIHAQDPLWKMPEKGVFTQDFVDDLRAGRCDMVVHSWKDLPIAPTPGTRVVATLSREDARDLLLVNREAWKSWWKDSSESASFQILSSSPRRAHNLQALLSELLPSRSRLGAGCLTPVEFIPVRGNIPTRLRKLHEGTAQGLIVAKAALDRLLKAADRPGFQEVAAQIRKYLEESLWMVLPLEGNPTAAAQGALAIEVAEDAAPELLSLLTKIHCAETFEAVKKERAILASYGGGCHQKIGVSVLTRSYGEILSLRGESDVGLSLDAFSLSTREELSNSEKVPAPEVRIFPENPKTHAFFQRESLQVPECSYRESAFWVARASAWPESWEGARSSWEANNLIWSAGLQTWKSLARRGVWVQGSAEGLGEVEDPRVETLCGRPLRWIKLTHEEAARQSQGTTTLATYRLTAERPSEALLEALRGATHYYWMSGSSFRQALEWIPEMRTRSHACGPGSTWRCLKEILGPEASVSIALSHAHWRASLDAKTC